MTRERLLQFLYQTPIGIVQLDATGNIGLMNAYATRFLLPLASGQYPDNLFSVLQAYLPELPELVTGFDRQTGTILTNRRFTAELGSGERVILSLALDRLDADLYMATLADATELAEQEERLRRARDEEAEQRGRMEIAGSVLHDIGNAITGISTSVSRLLSDDEWPEIQELQRLRVLLDSQSGALSTALGEARERALRDFVRQLTEKLEERRDELVESYQGMANIVGHISETLAVQRQYASEWVSGDRPRVSLQQLVADALAMQQASFEKRGIRVENSEGGPGDEGAQSAGGAGGGVGAISLEGDRTKLVRVFVNILKNAAESFDCRGRSGGPSAGPRTHPGAAEADADAESSARVTITLSTDGAGYARVRIADNGCGFDAEPGDDVTAEGYTSKDSSRGIGLYSAKRIVEGHGGSLQVSSPGLGAGSTVVVTLPTAAPHGRSEHGRTEQERS